MKCNRCKDSRRVRRKPSRGLPAKPIYRRCPDCMSKVIDRHLFLKGVSRADLEKRD